MKTVPHLINERFSYIEISCLLEQPDLVIVTLDRPQKRNAINSKFWKEIGQVFEVISENGDCRCILLLGKGPAFCGGIDIDDSSFFPVATADSLSDVAHVGITFLPKLRQMQACFTALEECSIPIVVAVHGKCIGAGIDLICAADIRICSPETVFSVREVAIGLAADVGTLQRLPKITGNQSLVNELCLTGRDFGSAEAISMGLVSRVTNKLQEDAVYLCKIICSHSPVAVHGTKKALLYSRDHTVKDGLEQVGTYNALALQSEDLPSAFAARALKRKPEYRNLPHHSKL